MKEPPRRQRPRAKPARPAEGAGEAEEVLAVVPEGERDVRLERDDAPQPAAARRTGDDEALALPEGAWLALRKSGGLLFSSREVVVYGDGRVTGSAIGGGRPERDARPRRLSAARLAALRRAAEQVDFGRLPARAGRQGRDAFVYELAVRSGRATHAVEVFEGAIPELLAPLLDQLNRLLPRDET
jgi:hypothetical protein